MSFDVCIICYASDRSYGYGMIKAKQLRWERKNPYVFDPVV